MGRVNVRSAAGASQASSARMTDGAETEEDAKPPMDVAGSEPSRLAAGAALGAEAAVPLATLVPPDDIVCLHAALAAATSAYASAREAAAVRGEEVSSSVSASSVPTGVAVSLRLPVSRWASADSGGEEGTDEGGEEGDGYWQLEVASLVIDDAKGEVWSAADVR